MCTLIRFSRVPTLQPHGLQPARLLCPRGSPGKNTGVGCQVLLQGIFPTQGPDLSFPHWQVDSLPSEPAGKPRCPRRAFLVQLHVTRGEHGVLVRGSQVGLEFGDLLRRCLGLRRAGQGHVEGEREEKQRARELPVSE